jgi:hypothetical protein
MGLLVPIQGRVIKDVVINACGCVSSGALIFLDNSIIANAETVSCSYSHIKYLYFISIPIL